MAQKKKDTLPEGVRLHNGRYCVRGRDANEGQYHMHFPDVETAEIKRHELRTARLEGQAPVRQSTQRFGEFVWAWHKSTPRDLKTRSAQFDYIKLWINPSAETIAADPRKARLPHLGKKRLRDIRKTDVQRWIDHMNRVGVAPRSIRNYLSVVRAVLWQAVDDELIPKNPALRVRLPKPEKFLPRRLTPKEVQEVADAVPERFRALVLLGRSTGLRISEACAVRLSNLDHVADSEGNVIVGGWLEVDAQLTEVSDVLTDENGEVLTDENGRELRGPISIRDKDGRLRLDPPKSDRGYRRIPLPPDTVEALNQHIAKFGVGEAGLVFTSPEGQPLPPSNFRNRVWRPFTKKVVGESVRWHTFRKVVADEMAERGVDYVTIAYFLGDDPATVMEWYRGKPRQPSLVGAAEMLAAHYATEQAEQEQVEEVAA